MNPFALFECPMPDCKAHLYVKWELAQAIYAQDLEHWDALDLIHAESATWQVECIKGHVVLVPGDLGCGCEDPEGPDCKHDPNDYDWTDENRTFRGHDAERLRNLLKTMAELDGDGSVK